MEKILKKGVGRILATKRAQTRMDSWFDYQEIRMCSEASISDELEIDEESLEFAAMALEDSVKDMPISIPAGSAIAGTLDDAFSPSYALINPSFKVESFAGYCDPLAVYDDIEPDDKITQERIDEVREFLAESSYVKRLNGIYSEIESDTAEVAYFVEPVTGHVIPDMRPILANGISGINTSKSPSMRRALNAAAILAERYSKLALSLAAETSDPDERARLALIAANCSKVPAKPAENLHEAIQSFALLWQVMCLEQAPNPYAISVGNLDRILQPYLRDTPRGEAIQLVRHLLAFFMVGDRCWAISQNIMVGGKNHDGTDLTNDMTGIVLDAFFESNNPQPALSVKLHRNSPQELIQSLGRFFFTPGHSTPSIFNDDEMFEVLKSKGIAEEDLQDYGIAGCQEPLIMGKESANTTNSWLNLAKILELTINDGKSLLTGKRMGLSWKELGYSDSDAVFANIRAAFDKQLDHFLKRMRNAANACTVNLGTKPAPFTSVLLGCVENGRDYRDPTNPGVKYHASGCLVHGLSVAADSFSAVDELISAEIASPDDLISALKNDFKGSERIRDYLLACPKYGNALDAPDSEAAILAEKVCRKISSLKNSAGNSFLPDFSTPSTHLLYGYWVGATPDGRKAREMLGYGIDPRPGAANAGVQARILSAGKLPFRLMTGGYASHIGLSPADFADAPTPEEKGFALWRRIIQPMFADAPGNAGYYLYFNIDTGEHLQAVLKEPEKHAPNGIYIMRIHGTFVNFLDLSPAIQQDIIARLNLRAA